MPRKKKEVKEQTSMPAVGQLAIVGNEYQYSILGKRVQYNPSNISLATYDEMRNHPTIASALAVAKQPILAINWYIKAKDKKVKEFVYKNLSELWQGLIRDLLLAYDFGSSSFEKVWKIDSEGIKYDAFINISPYQSRIRVNPDGSFGGIIQQPYGTASGGDIIIPANKSFVYTHAKEFCNYYGKPRSRGAYTPWFVQTHMIESYNKYMQKFGSPQMIGYAPTGVTKVNDKEYPNSKLMLSFLESLQTASVGVLPHNSKDKNELEYFIDILENTGSNGRDYLEYIQHLDQSMFMGCLVPPLAVSQGGERGSHALAGAQIDLFSASIDGEICDLKSFIDECIIRPLVILNFGENVECEIEFSSVDKKDRETIRQILLALTQRGDATLARQYISDALGVEMTEGEIKLDNANVPPEKAKEEPKAKPDAKMSKLMFSKSPRALDSHVDFAKIGERFKKTEADINDRLEETRKKQRDALIAVILFNIKNGTPQNIEKVSLVGRPLYINTFADFSKELYSVGFDDVKLEEELPELKYSKDGEKWAVSNARNIANKQLNDIEFAAIATALYGVSKGLSEAQISFDVGKTFDDYVDNQVQDSISLTVHKVYEEGREYAFEEAGIKYLMWSAVLDGTTCDFCSERDGMIIEANNPEAMEFSPGNVHEHCRCIWVGVDELPADESVDWKAPTQKEQDKFYQ